MVLLVAVFFLFLLLSFHCVSTAVHKVGKVITHGNELMGGKATVVRGQSHQGLRRRGWGMCSYMYMVGAESHFGICLAQV